MAGERLLDVKDLEVSFYTYAGKVHAVRGVSFHVNRGETLAIVGESGCGKTVSVQSTIKLIPMPPGKIEGGTVLFDGKDLTAMSDRDLQSVRGAEIGVIFQDPMTSLNPTMTVGRQITEGLIKHQKLSAEKARQRAIEMLSLVEMPNPRERFRQYPHQFSGGMRQRVMIAIALSCNPKLLIADEPTTGLDVTIQAQILDLMKSLQTRMNTSIILITHDLGVVSKLADRIVVMYAGKVAEAGSSEDIFYDAQHPYTQALLKSVPRLHEEARRDLLAIPGTPPDLFVPPKGCAFAPRCGYAMRVCLDHQPGAFPAGDNHAVACWLMDPRAAHVRDGHAGRAEAAGARGGAS
ncbi:MAG: ABC transporter ATP-binding protein [Bacillota bacterium]|nr:ABC transporter ATP-binding protein [Bacillota bacterium]